MKKIMTLMLILFLSISIHGEIVKIKGGASYFLPQNKDFRDIYGSGGVSFGGELEYSVIPEVGIWIGAEFYSKKGQLSYTEEETSLQLFPLHGGIKFRMPGDISPYLGLGAAYYFFKEENDIGTVRGEGLGAIVQCGCLFRIAGPLFIDVQVAYSYCQVEPADFKEHLGGVHAGLNLGLEF